MATLTYVYADQTAVLGPLSERSVPGAFDLCVDHAARTSVPRGWEVIRLPLEEDTPPTVPDDDLLALANAVREVGLRHDDVSEHSIAPPVDLAERRVGHLRLLRTVE